MLLQNNYVLSFGWIINNFKFPKNSRLLNKADFEFLRTESQRFYFDYLVFYYKPSRVKSDSHRIGFSFSKKLGSAVVRNKVKRNLREEFRLSTFKKGGCDILVTINFRKLGGKPVVDKSFLKNIRLELSKALSKIAPQNV